MHRMYLPLWGASGEILFLGTLENIIASLILLIFDTYLKYEKIDIIIKYRICYSKGDSSHN